MCLIKKHKFPKIAFKPIKVYKIFNKIDSNKIFNKIDSRLYSPYVGTKVINNVIKAKHFRIPEMFWETEIHGCGVHAYTLLKTALFNKENLALFKDNPHMKIYECVIPPLTLYWNGKEGNIASRKLKIKKEILNDL